MLQFQYCGINLTLFLCFSFNRVALCMLVLHYIVEFVFHVARLCYFSEKSDLAANAWVVLPQLFMFCMSPQYVQAHTYTCMHTHTHMHTRMHAHIHSHTQSQQHMHMCTCMCTHTHTHTHKSDEVCLDSFNPASAAPGIIRVASLQVHWLPPEYSGFPSTHHYH